MKILLAFFAIFSSALEIITSTEEHLEDLFAVMDELRDDDRFKDSIDNFLGGNTMEELKEKMIEAQSLEASAQKSIEVLMEPAQVMEAFDSMIEDLAEDDQFSSQRYEKIIQSSYDSALSQNLSYFCFFFFLALILV
ncbi:Oidioi.mRNA.OKI2018_I69.PAR.g8812.t1.cds [Oikopleura dioica]|uniref:Oidioi.mRNA.OKI2018_I69.PAR.g8812.t1.cds n=1 Tax=Oikopleura dioica TaxID=34765 RepID=A0ABN7RNN6_OIKDI|nr:Oidioi.mRNA.OKI2018_I69.PAR.g8812.t1.cds [Oikopleura dioica]